jgi:bacterial/archaeal transporter family protein
MWLLFATLSAGLIGLYEVARKAAVANNAALPTLLAATLSGLVCLLPLALGSLFDVDWISRSSFRVENLSPLGHLLVACKSLLVTTGWALGYAAVRELPISIAAPLRASSPVFTVLLALLLFGERPTTANWLGMALLFSGYLGFASVGRREGIRFFESRPVFMLLLGTFIASLSGLYDKYLLQMVELPVTTMQFWFTFDNVLIQTALVGALWWKTRAQDAFHFRWAAAVAGLMLVLADQLYMRAVAMDGALISVISLTRRSSVLVSFVFGGLLFREGLLLRKAAPLSLILAGVLLLLW